MAATDASLPPRRATPAGEGMVWGAGAAVGATLLLLLAVAGIILVQGLGHFWPAALVQAELRDGTRVMGEITGRHLRRDEGREVPETQFRLGNRDLYGLDFRWIPDADITDRSRPADAFVVERLEYGAFLGFLREVKPGPYTLEAAEPAARLREAMRKVRRDEHETLAPLAEARDRAGRAMESLRLRRLRMEHAGAAAEDLARLDDKRAARQQECEAAQAEWAKRHAGLAGAVAVFADAGGREKEIAVREIVRAFQPNRLGVLAKAGLYASRMGELLLGKPREANTEGGIAPAIFGTVLMVILMSLFCMPFGVVAAIYLREYAHDGPLLRLVRIAVNNLAGVPSIVYGIFGLGFFVYGIGGSIDRLFFPERLPAPTFGTGGILWASLTLALLTVPVVIVSTEEALAAIPRGMREGSLALGATRWQTVRRVLLPMASPGILTGFILAMSRAAGEVAPLMITGVVKLAPSAPLDGQWPFLHLERKFMHLGFHIFDVGFQSPNVEAARPMVFLTTLVLLTLVVLLNVAAIVARNRMRRKFTLGAF